MNIKVPKLRFKEFKNDWSVDKLGILADVRDGTHDSPKYIDFGFPLITSKNLLSDGSIDFENVNYISDFDYSKINARSNVDKGDILFGMIGTIGNPVLVNTCNFAIKNVALIKEKVGLLNVFTYQYFKSPYIDKQFYKNNAGGTQKFIALGVIRDLEVNIPSLPEQQKISDFLSLVDAWIANLKKQKALLESYKKALMQKIFAREIRFKDEDGNDFPDWEEKRLGKYLKLASSRNKNLEIKQILSVSNKKGFITQEEQFEDHRVASKDISNYKIVNKGDFAYNPSRINVGSIARLINYEVGVVSPMYVIFKLKSDLDPVFFENLLNTHRFKYLVKIGCSGSVRDSLNFEDMEKFKLSLPRIDEQKTISDFLISSDKIIDFTSFRLTGLENWKKGLMQQMFI